MADDYLAQYLMALEKQAAADNPYSRFGGVADALGGQVIKASPDYGLGESVAAAAVLGLLGGGLDSMAQSYNAEKSAGLYDVLSGRVAAQPESLGNPLYKKALTYRDLIKAQRLRDIEEKYFDQGMAIDQADAIDALKADREIGNIQRREAATLLGKERALEALSGGGYGAGGDVKDGGGEIPGGVASSVDGGVLMEDGSVRDLKDSGGESKRRPGALTSMGKEIRGIEDSARGELKGGVFDTFADLKGNFDTMKNVYKFNDRPSTQVFLQSFARVNDPDSVVRGEELQNAKNTQTMLEAMNYSWSSLWTGEQDLSPDDKLRMLRAAGEKHNQIGGDLGATIEKQRMRVKALGGDPENVFGQYEYKPFDFATWAKQNRGKQMTLDEQLGASGTPTQPTIPQGLQAVPRDAIGEALRARGAIP